MGEQDRDNIESKEFFGESWVRSCCREAGAIDEARFVALGIKLKSFAEPYRTQIASVPSKFAFGPENLDVSRQCNWIENHVLAPISDLKDALTPEKQHYFQSVMFDHSSFKPDFEKTSQVLSELEDFAEAAFIELDMQATNHISTTTQLQFEIVIGLVEIINSQFPELRRKRMSGRANQLVRLAFKEITGWNRSLDDDIKRAVKRII